jgi:hypothetical protein
MKRPFPNGHRCLFGCNGYCIYVTAVAAGQSQRFYSGVGIFSWRYLSSPPQILLRPRFPLERKGLTSLYEHELPVRYIIIQHIGP